MKNNITGNVEKSEKSHVVYNFKCPESTCQRSPKTYVGFTTTTIKQRLQAHRNQGAIHQHFIDEHDRKPSLTELLESTEITYNNQNRQCLVIGEAIAINRLSPNLNVQKDADTVLPSKRVVIYDMATTPRNAGRPTEEDVNHLAPSQPRGYGLRHPQSHPRTTRSTSHLINNC